MQNNINNQSLLKYLKINKGDKAGFKLIQQIASALSTAIAPITQGFKLANKHKAITTGILLNSCIAVAVATPMADDPHMPKKRVPRSAGGEIVQPTAQNPSAVLIKTSSVSTGENAICSGVLIQPNVVLTAAHCVFATETTTVTKHYPACKEGETAGDYDPIKGYIECGAMEEEEEKSVPIEAAEITVHTGVTLTEAEKKENTYHVQLVEVIPKYDPENPTSRNDIAKLILTTTPTNTEVATLITEEEHKLMKRTFRALDKRFHDDPSQTLPSNVVARGWGDKETAPRVPGSSGSLSLDINNPALERSNELREVRLVARNHKEQASKYRNCKRNVICTSDNTFQRDICDGDSGGPLFFIKSDSSRVLTGIASKGSIGCVGLTGEFSDIHNNREWITATH